METLKGSVVKIVTHNTETGFSVFFVKPENAFSSISCVGTAIDIKLGECVKLTGDWKTNATFGDQFVFTDLEKSLPTDESGIEHFLSSGLFEGIGMGMAQRIVTRFGKDSLTIIRTNPESLLCIQGMTEEKIARLHETLIINLDASKTIVFLEKFGVNSKTAFLVYKKYHHQTQEIISNNPYLLTEFPSIGFERADAIALRMGIKADSDFRIESAMKYFLNQDVINTGNIFVEKKPFFQNLKKILKIKTTKFDTILKKLHQEEVVETGSLFGKEIIFLKQNYSIETALAKKALRLNRRKFKINEEKLDKLIARIEKEEHTTLGSKQRLAVKESIRNNFVIITGGPGVGKTTTIKFIAKAFKYLNLDVVGAAPTGKAAKRMQESIGQTCKTVHRLLEVVGGGDNKEHFKSKFRRNENNHISNSAIIVDECSMLDLYLAYSLFAGISTDSRIVLVGDVNQLPSVGPGNILRDLINSGVITVVVLDEIFRQAKDSMIVSNAHAINDGRYPTVNKSNDFYFITKREDEISDCIIRIVTQQIKQIYPNVNIMKDVQILTSTRKGQLGAETLNPILQSAFNPPSMLKKEHTLGGITYRVGDKIMQIRNNYNIIWKTYFPNGTLQDSGIGLFNGDTGTIIDINTLMEQFTIAFDERIVNLKFSEVHDIELAYAITTHKSQGSEYPIVIMPIVKGSASLETRNLLYTGVTRAKKMVILLGEPYHLKTMIANNSGNIRNTTLCEKMIAFNQIGLSKLTPELTSINSLQYSLESSNNMIIEQDLEQN